MHFFRVPFLLNLAYLHNMSKQEKNIFSLLPLEEFKALAGIDDREDRTARFCLVTATLTIEQYCRRKFLQKNHFEYIDFYGDLVVPLKEYPVSKVEAVYSIFSISPSGFIEPEFYQVLPDCGCNEDIPFSLAFSPAVGRLRGLNAIKVVYRAGYLFCNVPDDLKAACFELASWSLSRYRGKRIGMSGNIRGAGMQGEHFELSMPENVRLLLEPYRRKTI